MTDDRPVLRTPTGGAESRPERPAQWHGYPFVWAWNVSLGATSRTYIEGECRAAAEAKAPADAVYRVREDDPHMPGEWITVGMMVNDQAQQRVREYAQALTDWERALTAYRTRPVFHGSQPPEDDEPPEHEYEIVYRPTHLTGVVRARSLREAHEKLAPGEFFAPSGYGVRTFHGENGVTWHVGFDSCRSEILRTTDERVLPEQAPAPAPDQEPAEVPADEEQAEAPAAEGPAEEPAAAEDTATHPVPTGGRGVRFIKRQQ